jgi:hypothetical protein
MKSQSPRRRGPKGSLFSPDKNHWKKGPFSPDKRKPFKKAARPVDKILDPPRFSPHISSKDFSRSIDT